MVLAPGLIVDGRYIVRTFLGSGTFGEVYEVLDSHQGGVFALKLFKPVPGSPPWHEAQVLTHLESDYILPVRNADVAGGVPYLVTDLATHGTAEHGFSPLGVEPEIAVKWVRAACRGATRTHDSRLLHRDIKPGNLFRTASGDVLLGDFGLATLMDPSGQGPTGGTPVTMAPEVAAGGPTSIATDVYSLGATLYALLAGRYGHNEPTFAACVAAVAAGPPPPVRDVAPHVPLALAQRVERAMARAPADRFASPAVLDAALGQLTFSGRRWRRTDEHGHPACWRGSGTGADVTVCVVPSGARHAVEARYQPSGKAVPGASQPPVAAAQLPRRIRAAIAAAS